MRRWMAAPLLIAAVALIMPTEAPRALAQAAPDPIEETFRTADGIQLNGLFHKSAKNPANDPVVILLYPPGKENTMNTGDWKGLAARLQTEGFNVFRFDWRGHGKSKDIKDTTKFWNLPTPNDPNPNPFTGDWNRRNITGAPAGAAAKRIKDDLLFKDLKNADRYTPVYLLDLAAARHHLDTKNDGGELNMSSVYLIGSELAAFIGMGWLTTEWNRPAFAPTPNQLAVAGGFPTYKFVPQPLAGGITNEAGADISAAVWLTPTRPPLADPILKAWIAKGAPQLRGNNPMLFLTGEKDTVGKKHADVYYNGVLVAEPPKGSTLQKLDTTYWREVKGTDLKGVGLLGNNAVLKTEDSILNFIALIQKERAKLVRKNRGFTTPWYILLNGPAGFGFPNP